MARLATKRGDHSCLTILMLKSSLSKPIMGWDIGGAHLKAVLLDVNGNVLHILQLPCPLWRGLHELDSAIQNMLKAFRIEASDAIINLNHAVTMTGELVDLFANRHAGVMAISSLSAQLLGKETLFYAANSGFVRLDDVKRMTNDIASANWHASASALAMYVKDALLIDIGSTTTDIIPINNGAVAIAALSDAARLQNDTLVYTGVVRTPIMALAQKLAFAGHETNIAAEYFATMADVYRLTGDLDAAADMAETADGKGKTDLESARRLARMIGQDVDNYSLATWKNLAHTCKTTQMKQLKTALLKHLKPNMPIIGAGAGSFLVEALARELKHAYQPIAMVVAAPIDLSQQHDLALCLPAYAVALLAKKQLARQYA